MDYNIKQEKIELYLTGQLKGKDLEAFNKTLNTDETFAQDVEIMRDLEEAMSSFEGEKELSNKLKFLGKKYITGQPIQVVKTPRIVPMYRKKWFIAAATILLIVVGGLLFQDAFQSDTDYFASYYKPYPSNLLTRGDNDDTYSEIVKLYNEENFTEAIPLLEQRMIDIPNDTPSKVLLGNSYLSLKPADTKKAIDTFKSLANDHASVYQETAKWYLALAYIKNNESELAKEVLESLAKLEFGKYPKQAKELLEQQ